MVDAMHKRIGVVDKQVSAQGVTAMATMRIIVEYNIMIYIAKIVSIVAI